MGTEVAATCTFRECTAPHESWIVVDSWNAIWAIPEVGENLMNELFLKTYLKIRDLMTREEGQDLVEYALLITLVALAAVGGIRKVTSAINTVFSNISNTLA